MFKAGIQMMQLSTGKAAHRQASFLQPGSQMLPDFIPQRGTTVGFFLDLAPLRLS